MAVHFHVNLEYSQKWYGSSAIEDCLAPGKIKFLVFISIFPVMNIYSTTEC